MIRKDSTLVSLFLILIIEFIELVDKIPTDEDPQNMN